MVFQGMVVGGITFLVNLPKNLYEANVNYFTNKKEMDVYVRNNKAQENIYKQLDDKSQNIKTEEDRQDLAKNFMKMKMAHTQGPRLVNHN